MSDDLLRRFARSDDPEIEARRRWILRFLLAHSPEGKKLLIEHAIERGQLIGARAALRRVLARRGLALSAPLEAQIDACSELATLERWLDQAVTATTADDALV
ncbi:hypothetical protein [Sorangium sp. So ce117]|uniref:hypothetical protein n=1 Tax=Sorangium sp. So ce117 TaxID=3133277 RepID=UPI003F62D967